NLPCLAGVERWRVRPDGAVDVVTRASLERISGGVCRSESRVMLNPGYTNLSKYVILLTNRNGCSLQDPLGTAVVALPVASIQMIQAHGAAAAGCMDKTSLSHVDADMRDLRPASEEHQVGSRQALRLDLRPLEPRQLARGARQAQVQHVAEHVVDQADRKSVV